MRSACASFHVEVFLSFYSHLNPNDNRIQGGRRDTTESGKKTHNQAKEKMF